MKTMKICVVLLAFLLAGMPMVPMVSAAGEDGGMNENTKLIDANMVSGDLAREYSTITMMSMVQAGALDEKWTGAKIDPDLLTIYDLNGEPLFYLFTVKKNGERVGEIYAAASKVIGTPVVAIGSIQDPEKLKSLVNSGKPISTNKSKPAEILSYKLVCFNYPIIGLMTTVKDSDTGNIRYIITDPRDGSEMNFDQTTLLKNSKTASYYGQISRDAMIERVSEWNTHNYQYETIKAELLSKYPTFFSNPDSVDVSAVNQIIADIKDTEQKNNSVLTDNPKIITGLIHIVQYFDEWCAVATAEIISSKYMSEEDLWSQYHIADMMGAYNYSANPPTPKGTEPYMERDGYYRVSLANGGLGKPGSIIADIPSLTTFEEAQSEINADRPFKVGNATPMHHARACAGWFIDGGTRYLLFYDPAGYGSIYWESVPFGVYYPNFVYVRD